MGYAVYRLFVEHRSEATFEKTLIVSSNTLENERIRVEFSKETAVHIRRKKSHTVIGEKEGGLYLILPQIPPPRFQPFNRRRRNIRKKLMGIIGIFIHIHAEIIDTPQITR